MKILPYRSGISAKTLACDSYNTLHIVWQERIDDNPRIYYMHSSNRTIIKKTIELKSNCSTPIYIYLLMFWIIITTFLILIRIGLQKYKAKKG